MAVDVVVYDKVGKESEKIQDALYALYPQATITDAAIASFDDGSDGIPVKELVVGVEPAQDLHGYDNPWPTGGGKNIANLDTVTLSTARMSGDLAELTITQSANYGTLLFNIKGKANTVYTCSAKVKSTSTGGSAYFSVGGGNYTATTVGNTYIGQVTTDANGESTFNLRPPSASEESNSAVFAEVQVEEGTTKTNFAPYSNICPISGWTGAEIEGCGKNLLDPSLYSYSETYVVNGITWTHNDDGTIIANGTATADSTAGFYLSGHYDGNYYFSSGLDVPTSTADCYMWNSTLSERCKRWDGTTASANPYVGNEPKEVQLNKSDRITFSLRVKSGQTVNNLVIKPMLLMPTDTDPTYAPYTGSQISVTFPSSAGTVYGGTLTINPDRTGSLVVKYAKKTFNGSESWTTATGGYRSHSLDYADGVLTEDENIKSNYLVHMLYNQSNGQPHFMQSGAVDNHNIFVRFMDKVDANIVDVASFKAYLAEHPLEVVYKLASPQTYQLTASEVSGILTTLYGTNNVWADCGDIEKLTYRADLGKYIDSHITTAVANALNA